MILSCPYHVQSFSEHLLTTTGVEKGTQGVDRSLVERLAWSLLVRILWKDEDSAVQDRFHYGQNRKRKLRKMQRPSVGVNSQYSGD